MEKARLYGRQYILDSCIEMYSDEQREKAYRMYIAESLRILTDNTSRMNGGYVQGRLSIYDKQQTENRTAEEIVEDVSRRAGITIKGR